MIKINVIEGYTFLTLYSLFDCSKSPLKTGCLFCIFERWQEKWKKKDRVNQNINRNVLNVTREE